MRDLILNGERHTLFRFNGSFLEPYTETVGTFIPNVIPGIINNDNIFIYLPLNEGEGTFVRDWSGKERHGSFYITSNAMYPILTSEEGIDYEGVINAGRLRYATLYNPTGSAASGTDASIRGSYTPDEANPKREFTFFCMFKLPEWKTYSSGRTWTFFVDNNNYNGFRGIQFGYIYINNNYYMAVFVGNPTVSAWDIRQTLIQPSYYSEYSHLNNMWLAVLYRWATNNMYLSIYDVFNGEVISSGTHTNCGTMQWFPPTSPTWEIFRGPIGYPTRGEFQIKDIALWNKFISDSELPKYIGLFDTEGNIDVYKSNIIRNYGIFGQTSIPFDYFQNIYENIARAKGLSGSVDIPYDLTGGAYFQEVNVMFPLNYNDEGAIRYFQQYPLLSLYVAEKPSKTYPLGRYISINNNYIFSYFTPILGTVWEFKIRVYVNRNNPYLKEDRGTITLYWHAYGV